MARPATGRLADIVAQIAGLDAACPLHEAANPQLGVAQKPVEVGVESDSSLVEDERLLERLAAGLEGGHGPLELVERRVEGQRGHVRRDRRGRAGRAGSGNCVDVHLAARIAGTTPGGALRAPDGPLSR